MKQFYTHGAGSSIEFQRALTLETIDQISTGSVVFTWGGSAQIDVWIVTRHCNWCISVGIKQNIMKKLNST